MMEVNEPKAKSLIALFFQHVLFRFQFQSILKFKVLHEQNPSLTQVSHWCVVITLFHRCLKLLILLLKKSVYLGQTFKCVCMGVCELQGKVKDAMVWLALQEKKVQKMLTDSENETYCKTYEVSMTLNSNFFVVYSQGRVGCFQKKNLSELII